MVLLCAAFLALSFLLVSGNVSAEETEIDGKHYVWGTIGADTTWKSGGTYVVNSTVTVQNGYALTIQKGVEVLIDEGQEILVRGSLRVEGSEEQQVNFGPNGTATSWAGISVVNGNASVSHAVIFKATYGLTGSTVNQSSSVIIENSQFNTEISSIWLQGYKAPIISGNIIRDANAGIHVGDNYNVGLGNVTVIGNEVNGIAGAGIEIVADYHDIGNITITGNRIDTVGSDGLVISAGYRIGNVTIEGDDVRNTADRGISIDAKGSIYSLAIAENNVWNTTAGIVLEAESIGGLDILDNRVGNSIDGSGIYVNGRYGFGDVTVTGNHVWNTTDGTGIYLKAYDYYYWSGYHDFGDVVISNNHVWNNGYGGIGIYGEDFGNITIEGNTAEDNGGDGIEIYADTLANVTVTGNTAEDNGGDGIGIYADSLANVTISGNIAESNGGDGIDIGVGKLANATITENIATGNGLGYGDYGIYLWGGSFANVTVTGNTFRGNGGNGIGIYADSLANVTVTGNTAEDNDGDGIEMDADSLLANVTVAGNTFRGNGGNGIGIYADTLANATITENIAEDNNGNGIEVSADTLANVTVTENIATGNGLGYGDYGIYLWGGSFANVTVTGNTFRGNGGDGAELSAHSLSNVTVTGNTAEDNDGDGIEIYADSLLANVTVAGNTFRGNGGNGIEIYADSLANVTVTGNTAEDNDDDGIYIYARSNNYIENSIIENVIIEKNTVKKNENHGIYLGYGLDGSFINVTIADNTVVKNENGGIDVEFYNYAHYYYLGIVHLFIETNIVEDNGDDGIYVRDDIGLVVVGVGNNTVLNNLGSGIYIRGAGRVDLYNNEISNNLDWGVYVADIDEARWLIDASAIVRSNNVAFQGDVVIDGTLLLNSVETFLVNYEWDGGSITVNKEGTLNAINSNIGTDSTGLLFYGNSYVGNYRFEVFGALNLNAVKVFHAVELYLGPTSKASISGSAVYVNQGHGVVVDGSAPSILNSNFVGNGLAGIFIIGEEAKPLIRGNTFILNQHGILANGADLGNVIGNTFYLNSLDGINVVNAPSGKIIGNTFLLNRVEIAVESSTVSITGNKIGYSSSFPVETMFDLLIDLGYLISSYSGNYLPYPGSAENVFDLLTNHVGISILDSEVTTSGNTYGALITAISLTNSTLNFGDDILLPKNSNETVSIPYYALNLEFDFRSTGNLVSQSAETSSPNLPWLIKTAELPLALRNGITATGSTVNIEGSTIQVLDLAVLLDGSKAEIKDSDLSKSSQGLLLINDSHATLQNTKEGVVQFEDTSSVEYATDKGFGADLWILGLVAAIIVIGVVGVVLYARKQKGQK